MSTQRAKEIAAFKKDLQASSDVIIADTLNKIGKKGDASLIPDLLAIWGRSETLDIKKSVESILFGLKSTNALDVLMQFITNTSDEAQKGLALTAIWQSGYSAAPFLDQLVDIAIHGSYAHAIDVMTIIDASEFDENHEDLIDSNLVKIKEQLHAKMPETAPIVLEIKSILIDKKIDQ